MTEFPLLGDLFVSWRYEIELRRPDPAVCVSCSRQTGESLQFLTVAHTLSSTSDNNAVTKVTLQLMIFSDPSTNTLYNSIRATEMSNVICLYQALSGRRRERQWGTVEV